MRASASWRGSGHGPGSARVTSLPKRASICVSSTPTGPEPSTTTLEGTSRRVVASRFVQNGTSARPSTGGREVVVPVATTTRSVRSVRSPTRTSRPPPASSRPGPRTTSIPCASSFRVFFVSSRPEFMYSRYARTSSQRGAGVDPRPGTCAASARTSTGRRRVFEGMQAQNGHSPPTSSCSTTATAIPPAARAWAV